MWEKIKKLYCLDEDHCENLSQYIIFRIKEYDDNKDIHKSFDDYIEYCIHMLENLV